MHHSATRRRAARRHRRVDPDDADLGDARRRRRACRSSRGRRRRGRGRTGAWEERSGRRGRQWRGLTDERSFAIVAPCRTIVPTSRRLQDYYARHRALPSYASIGQLLGLKSKSSVAAMVARLKLAGFIDSTPDKRLAPTRRFFARPLAESPVHAGMPNPIDDADGRRADDRRLPDRAAVADGADPRQGRFDDGRRHPRRRSRRRREGAPRRSAATSSSRSSTTSSR